MTLRTVSGIAALLILFSAAAQSGQKLSANDVLDQTNLKMLGQAWAMYGEDADDRAMIAGWQCTDPTTKEPKECSDYYAGTKLVRSGSDLSPESRTSFYWPYTLEPYTKKNVFNPNYSGAFWGGGPNKHWFDSPDAKGQNVGGQNSYGYNVVNLSPWSDANGSPIMPTLIKQIPRPSQSIVFSDATFYLVAPDVHNESHLRKSAKLDKVWSGSEAGFADAQNQFYANYWKNVGGSDWSYGYGNRSKGSSKLEPELAFRRIGALSTTGDIYAIAADGHLLQLSPTRAIADICSWTTDRDGPHPYCAN